ncbi:MAG TPA: hypothetical protein VFS80_08370 [Burkholderiales bacterium]|nr:hypothetical protein [Burkholderiales bacterium]
MPLLRSLLAWLVILGLAITNGVLREEILIPALGKPGGLILSGVLLCMLIVLVAYGLLRFTRHLTASKSLLIGVLWLSLTLAFEFSFGRYVQHKSWAELLDAYAFKEGNIWPVVLVVTLLAPYLAFRLRAAFARRLIPDPET